MKKSLIIVAGIIILAVLAIGIYLIPTEARLLPTQLTVTPLESTIPWGDSVILTATLTSNGDLVEGVNINWSIPPEPFVHISPNPSITDSSGLSSVSFETSPWIYSTPPSQENATITIIASFAGNNRYQGSTGSASVVVW